MTTFDLRRVDRNTYDVFQGNQWSTWSRVRQGRSSTYRLAGEPLSHAMLKELHAILAPNMPINYGQDPITTLRNCVAIGETR